ncbi:MAG: biopolymer transporter ExbD [Bacteroidales bacterium]|nr:biopolymer transporter ExbD [Bacteroidales bacterium]
MLRRREPPEINAGSMADIAFQLLLFFLIATTFNTDMGILRKLPPMPDEENPLQQETVKERNVFTVLVNYSNQLQVEGRLTDIRELRGKAMEFIENPDNDADLPEKVMVEVPFFGQVPVTKHHVISLQNDRGTSYGTYIAVQNELTAAYAELRNRLSLERFNVSFNELATGDPRREAIETIYPVIISEAEPKDIGGTEE